MANDLHDFASDMQRLAASLSGPQMRRALDEVGVPAKRDAADAGRRDLGDGRFSGWPRAGALAARYTIHRDNQGITIHRDRRSAGPWKVAEDGRNQGKGPGSQRRGRRWNGRTRGMGTWSDAEALIESRTPARVEKAVEAMVLKVVGLGR